jgi:hypothetical protein
MAMTDRAADIVELEGRLTTAKNHLAKLRAFDEVLAQTHDLRRARRKQQLRDDRDIRRELAAEERPAAPPPEGYVLTDFLAEPDAPHSYLIDGILPLDSTLLLAAQAKAGKTTFVTNLVRSLADGVPFLGRHAVAPFAGKVALIDLEMGTRMLKQWHRKQGIANTDRVVVFPMRGKATAFDIRDDAVRAEWARRLRAHDVKVLIIDCLRPLLDALNLDENHEVGVILERLTRLITDADVPYLVLVHHMGHEHERARGDSSLLGWPAVLWKLTRDGETRFFSAEGRDVSEKEQALEYDDETRRLTVAGGTRSEVRVEAALIDVLDFIRREGPSSQNAVVQDLQAKAHVKDVIKQALDRGVRTGQLAEGRGARGARIFSVVTEGLIDLHEIEVEM